MVMNELVRNWQGGKMSKDYEGLKKVSIRDIRLHGIPDKLPVLVTRYNKPFAKIISYKNRKEKYDKEKSNS